jgi:thiol-disulfide isomerase/thioredoxin
MLGANPTRRRLAWSVAAALAALALALGFHFGGGVLPWGEVRRIDAGTLFGLTLPDPDGGAQSLGQWKGKVLVVNFWATWCVPCREEMPQFVKAQRDLGGRGLQFVGIAIDQADKAKAFATELGLNYPTLIGGYGAIELSKTFGNRLGALPFTIVVDRSGNVVHTQLGPLTEKSLGSIVAQLL